MDWWSCRPEGMLGFDFAGEGPKVAAQMTCVPIELPFRGQRTYLQGADLYNAVVPLVLEQHPHLQQAPISVNYHSLLQEQPDVLIAQGELAAERAAPEFRGEFVFGAGDSAVRALLMASSRPVAERIPCFESDLIAPAEIDHEGRRGTLENPGLGTAADIAVALNKKLHHAVLPHITAKWILVRLVLPSPLPQQLPRRTEVRLQGLMGDRMTRSQVLFDEKPAGTIYFCTPA